MKKGDEFVSDFDETRRLIIRDSNKKSITVEVDRRVIDKNTGEIKLDRRTREVPISILPVLMKSYHPAK